ncbi:MAG: metal-dependent hydrolase [Candidatus Nanohaloarchaea archaeon]
MDSLFHFVVSFLAGMSINPRLKHRIWDVAAVALAGVLIDIDHLLFSFPRAFHNVFVAVLLPLTLFYIAFRREDGVRYQSLSLLLLVVLVGHMLVDLFNGGVIKPFYPVLGMEMMVQEFSINFIRDSWSIATSDSLLLAFNAVFVSLAYFAEDFIYLFEQKHEQVGEAVAESLDI